MNKQKLIDIYLNTMISLRTAQFSTIEYINSETDGSDSKHLPSIEDDVKEMILDMLDNIKYLKSI